MSGIATALDHQLAIDGIFFRTWAGCPWRDLPERFGNWSWSRGWAVSGRSFWGALWGAEWPPGESGDSETGAVQTQRTILWDQPLSLTTWLDMTYKWSVAWAWRGQADHNHGWPQRRRL